MVADRERSVAVVWNHYRTHHPRSPKVIPRPAKGKAPDWDAVNARLDEGWSVEDLCFAIDGCHLTPHNQGQNTRGTKYLGFELILRNTGNVQRFLEAAHIPPEPQGAVSQEEILMRNALKKAGVASVAPEAQSPVVDTDCVGEEYERPD